LGVTRVTLEKRISKAKKSYSKFLDPEETIIWADEFFTLLTDVRLVSFKPLFLKALLEGSNYQILISMPIADIREKDKPMVSGSSTEIKLKNGKTVTIKSPLTPEEVDEFLEILGTAAIEPKIIGYLQTVTPEIRAEIKVNHEIEMEETKRTEHEDFDENYGSVVVSRAFSTKWITIYSKGYVKVSSGMGALKGRVEKLLDIFGETDITRKTGLGRTVGAVITLGANMLLSPSQRGNVYLTITTDSDTYSILTDRPDDYAIKTMNEIVSAGKSVIARANTASNPAASNTTTAPSSPDLATQLGNLAQLRDSGVLSEEEFEKAKAKLLG
jgi:hypothetical protein